MQLIMGSIDRFEIFLVGSLNYLSRSAAAGAPYTVLNFLG